MQVDSTIFTSVVVPPEVPAARPIVREAPQGRPPDRDRRDLGREERSAEFRAELDAAIGGLLGDTPLAAQNRFAAQEARPEKLPTDDDLELSGEETIDILSASRNASRVERPLYLSKPYFAATQQYAQRFFSVGGTFAKRGDTLEITA